MGSCFYPGYLELCMVSSSDIQSALSGWGFRDFSRRDDLAPMGSPLRCEFRTVISKDELFVLESVKQAEVGHKELVAQAMLDLSARGFSAVHPYLKDSSGGFVRHAGGRSWMLRPYVSGTPLPRPGYGLDAWRGRAAGELLVRLESVSQGLKTDSDPAYLSSYLPGVFDKIQKSHPLLEWDLEDAIASAQDALSRYSRLPVGFCHGDYHPLNLIWTADGIASVIDWEFCGHKPVVYDIANLVSCVGFEHPNYLTGPLVYALFETVRKTHLRGGFSDLFDVMLLLRFAWLAEWLYGCNDAMVSLETKYLKLLVDKKDALLSAWEAGSPRVLLD